ncbi:MAG: TolC family protein [Gemmatimonadota bacterium]
MRLRECEGLRSCRDVPTILTALILVGIGGVTPTAAQDGASTRSPGIASAAEQTQEPRRLTLQEAIDRAHATNPAYRRSVNDLELNEVESREVWLDFLPQPTVTLLRTNMQWNRATVGTDNFGNPIPNPELRMIQSARSDQFASLVWELDFGDWYRRQATRLRGEEREIEVDRVGNALTSEVRSAFLDAQEMREFRRLEERLVEIQAVNREIAERGFRLAQVDRPDLLEAELDYAEQQNRLEERRAELSATLLRLRNVIGDRKLGAFEIAPAPLRIFNPAVLDTEALVENAVASGPDVRAAAIGLEVAERDVSLHRAEWFPTLEVRARTGRRQLSRESGDAFLQPIPDGEWDRTVGFTLSFPDLGTWFSRGAAGHREEVEVRNARSSLRETRLRVEEEVRGLVVELQNQHRRLEVQERRAELARERLELQQERYRLGQIDYLELQNSVETAADAERQALEARYAFERALHELERARGAPLRLPADE